MWKLRRYLKHYIKETLVAPLFKFFEACLELIVPVMMAEMIDVGIKNGNTAYCYFIAAVLVGFAALGLVCALIAQYYAAKAAHGYGTELRSAMYAKINSFSHAELDRLGMPALITRITADINQSEKGVNRFLRLFLRAPFIVVGALVASLIIDWKLGLIFVAVTVVMGLFVWLIMALTIPRNKTVQRMLEDINGLTRENLTGARVVRAFARQEKEIADFKKKNERMMKMQSALGVISSLLNPVTYVFVNLGIVFVLVFGGGFVNAGTLTQGEISALINYMSQILIELIKLVALVVFANLIVVVASGSASSERVYEVLQMHSALVEGDKENPEKPDTVLEFRNVSFGYNAGGDNAVENISFTLQRGQTLGIVVCIAALCYFKYTGFLTDNWNRLTGLNAAIPTIAAPLGVSFFTFLAISYLADVRRGTIPAERSFGCLLLYFTFFPKAAQGPLMRYDGLAPQLAQRRADLPTGIERFILGLGKKVLLAEAAGKIASQVFVLSAVALTPGKMWLGAICYALQIFFDFAGYTDMALGLGRMFGFALPENFNYPYLADSVTDFWRRWHMTLSQWFRDYVYIPLGGNRCGRARQLLNILIVWALTGIWHGANWTFLLWGLYYAVFLMIEKVFLLKRLEKLPVLGHIYTIIIVMFGWVMFQLDSLAAIGNYTSAMLGFGASGLAESTDLYYLGSYAVTFVIAIVASTPLGSRLFAKLPGKVRRFAAPALIVLALVLCTAYLVDATYNPFIYFNF